MVLCQEIDYQDDISLATQLQAGAMSVTALASVMAMIMGGTSEGVDPMNPVHNMLELVQTLLTGEKSQAQLEAQAMSEREKELQAELLDHPMFQKFRAGQRGEKYPWHLESSSK